MSGYRLYPLLFRRIQTYQTQKFRASRPRLPELVVLLFGKDGEVDDVTKVLAEEVADVVEVR